jgi:hypothetical protein
MPNSQWSNVPTVQCSIQMLIRSLAAHVGSRPYQLHPRIQSHFVRCTHPMPRRFARRHCSYGVTGTQRTPQHVPTASPPSKLFASWLNSGLSLGMIQAVWPSERTADLRRMHPSFERDPAARRPAEHLLHRIRSRAHPLLLHRFPCFIQHAMPARTIAQVRSLTSAGKNSTRFELPPPSARLVRLQGDGA